MRREVFRQQRAKGELLARTPGEEGAPDGDAADDDDEVLLSH